MWCSPRHGDTDRSWCEDHLAITTTRLLEWDRRGWDSGRGGKKADARLRRPRMLMSGLLRRTSAFFPIDRKGLDKWGPHRSPSDETSSYATREGAAAPCRRRRKYHVSPGQTGPSHWGGDRRAIRATIGAFRLTLIEWWKPERCPRLRRRTLPIRGAGGIGSRRTRR